MFINPQLVPRTDITLIKALAGHWRPETNSFHFHFGEMMITLEDVYMIMLLLISRCVVTHTELSIPIGYWIRHWEDLRIEIRNNVRRCMKATSKTEMYVGEIWREKR